MRKLAWARVSHLVTSWFPNNRVYMFTYFFLVPWPIWRRHPAWIDETTIPMHYPFQSTGKPISHRNERSRLHDTVPKLRPEVKLSLRCNNWGELTPVWLVPAWHFVVVSCHEREPEWTWAGAKVEVVRELLKRRWGVSIVVYYYLDESIRLFVFVCKQGMN